MHWEKAGPENTQKTAELVLQRAGDLGIKYLIIASNEGNTVEHFINKNGFQIICVTHQAGFRNPGEVEMSGETKEKLQKAGIKILTTTHLMGGLDRAVRNRFGGLYPAEIIANSLRMLGQGIKVCTEISVMALDAGLIPFGQDVIAVAGTVRGADTAVVITPAHSSYFFDTKIKEIICKPRTF